MKIYQFEGAGYKPLILYNGWRVAMAGFAEHLLEENLRKLERHLQTDEVFILLQGEAVLHIGMKKERCPMEIGKIYNVLCGEWHAISMTPGTIVAIVENDDTGAENTEYYYF